MLSTRSRCFPLLLLAAIVMVAAGLPSVAHTLSLKAAQAAVSSATHGGMKAESVFAGPDGLTGAVAVGNGGFKSVVWLTRHGQAVIVQGSLMGRDGKNYTQNAMYSTGILKKPAAVLKTLLAKGDPIHAGHAGPVVTVLFDPNCIFCHLLHKAFLPLVNAGKLQVNYVLVGIIKPDSFGKASSILQAKDPLDALNEDEAHFNKKTEEGGYPVAQILHATYERTVRDNAVAMQQLGSTGTPTLLYCGKGGHVHMQAGMPQAADAFVAGLGSCGNASR